MNCVPNHVKHPAVFSTKASQGKRSIAAKRRSLNLSPHYNRASGTAYSLRSIMVRIMNNAWLGVKCFSAKQKHRCLLSCHTITGPLICWKPELISVAHLLTTQHHQPVPKPVCVRLPWEDAVNTGFKNKKRRGGVKERWQ